MATKLDGNPFAQGIEAGNPFAQAVPATKPLSPDVELEGARALEIAIAWGDDVLHVAHHAPPRDVVIGEEGDVAFRIPAEKLGASQRPLARVEGATVVAYVPRDADAVIEIPGKPILDANAARAASLLVPSEVEGCDRIDVPFGARVRIHREGFAFRIGLVAAAKKPVRGSRARRAVIAFLATSAAAHAAVVAALMFSPGASLDDENAGLDKATAAYVMQLQKNNADHEIEKRDEESTQDSKDAAGGDGKKHSGAEGQMGDPSKNAAKAFYQVKGPPDTAEMKIAKTRALIESGNIGAIGALSSVFGSSVNAPIMFDSDSNDTIGRNPADFNGNLQGDHPGDAFGYNGLGMFGTAPGGGGMWNGIGLDRVGDFGHGAGCTSGNCGSGIGPGIGTGPGKTGLARKPGTVRIPEGGGDTIGKLPPEAIKRIIHANFPRFRACYEQGLKKDPGLRGSVKVRFIIDTTGAVETASLAGGSMSDPQVSSCTLGVYKSLSFPEPEAGKVMVTYPIDYDNE
ncbi:MAG: AgmX/PglI C-terminal domain-containing protein [Polyangiales bacterium]